VRERITFDFSKWRRYTRKIKGIKKQIQFLFFFITEQVAHRHLSWEMQLSHGGK